MQIKTGTDRLATMSERIEKGMHVMETHTREFLSEHDALRLLNYELSAYEECMACHFTSVKRANAVDASGCNWRGADLQVDGTATETARRITKHVVDEVRGKYNLA
jgi:hypothetical protein